MSMASPGTTAPPPGHFSPAALLGTAPQGGGANPQMKDLLGRIAEACVTPFDKMFGEGINVTCALTSIANETPASFLASIDKTAVTATFSVPVANAQLVVCLDYDFVQLYIDLMCGGTCGEPTLDPARAGTAIDRQFARSALNLIASAFEAEAAPFQLGAIAFAQIETKLDPLVLGSRVSKTVVATMTLEYNGTRVKFRAAWPEAVTSRLKDESSAVTDAMTALDPIWSGHFQSEIGRTMVKLDAYLDGNSLRLGDIANLKIGQTLLLPRNVSSRCELRSDKKLLFRCELGQTDGHYSVRISETSPSLDQAGPALQDVNTTFE